MVKFTEIERVFACEVNSVVTPPFPTTLPPFGTVDLCQLSVPIGRDRDGFVIHAVVNWSATFTGFATPLVLATPGFAQITFELLRDGGPIQRVVQTAGQVGFTIGAPFTGSSTTFEIATMLHLDTTSLTGIANPIATFILRATNILLSPPLTAAGTPAGTITAAAGLTSLIVEEVEACRAQAMNT